ncbi:hypothetical protein V7138_23855 [Bacillus sp. JJ1533]|uniref:LptM family lipoprotein n=1 Tax=Bacillus sp. JJ1533 TaxID=3122959 RepID=UPI00300071EE
MSKRILKIVIAITMSATLYGCATKQPEPFADDQPQISKNRQRTLTADDPNNSLLTAQTTPLPFEDFKERWNALTDAQMSNLYIKELEKVTTEDNHYYKANLTNQIQLYVYVNENHVVKLEVLSEGKSQAVISAMLASWSQVINIFHSELEMQDVDYLFGQIGVGPNLDLSNVHSKSIEHLGKKYEIEVTENGYRFAALAETTQPE